MKTIDHPTTRRLLYGCVGTQHDGQEGPTIATDTPRLVLREEEGVYYSDRPTDTLQFTAQNGPDLVVLDRFYRRDQRLPGRLGSQARYRATLAGIRTLLNELGWTLTDDERRLLESLEAQSKLHSARAA
jgi:hypothetical protein